MAALQGELDVATCRDAIEQLDAERKVGAELQERLWQIEREQRGSGR